MPTPSRLSALACTEGQFKHLCKETLALCPIPRNYRVRFKLVPQADILAWVEKAERGNTFTVSVTEGHSYDHTQDLLIHELAHVIDWRPSTPLSCDHGPTFWIHYGTLYRAVYQVL